MGRTRLPLVLLTFLVLLSGCIGGTIGESGRSIETASLDEGVTCKGGPSVSFWGLSTDSQWRTDTMRISYGTEGNASFHIVAFVDGDVAATKYRAQESVMTWDGAGISLDEPLSGTHVVRVVAYDDAGGDELFEKGVDRPCLENGEVMQDGPRRIDFDRFPASED